MPSNWNPFKKDEKKPDDQSKSETEALLDAFSAKMQEVVKPIAEKVESVAAWQAKIEKQFEEPPPDSNKKPDGTELTAEEKAERDKNALFALTVQTNARITEEACLASIAAKWPQLVAEARGIFSTTNWQRKAQKDYAEYCNNVVDMLIGREAKKGGLSYNTNEKKFFIEDSAASTGGDDSPFSDPDLTWTDPRTGKTLTASEQLAKLRINPKEFAEFVKRQGGVL